MKAFKKIDVHLADTVANFIGSWTFIILQSSILTVWIIANIVGLVHFDIYPFILLNLFLSFEAAYATPLILMSSKRQGEKDSAKLSRDLELDSETNQIMKTVEKTLAKINQDLVLDKISLTDHKEMKHEISQIKAILEQLSEKLLN